MQASARHVLAENARLRALLKDRGMSEAVIDTYTTADGGISGNGAPPSVKLTNMLLTRKPCCTDNDNGSDCLPPGDVGSLIVRSITSPDTKPLMKLLPPHNHPQDLSSKPLAPVPIMAQSTTNPRTALPLVTTMPMASMSMSLVSIDHSMPSLQNFGSPSHSTSVYTAYPCITHYNTHWQPPALISSPSYDFAGPGSSVQTYSSITSNSTDQTTNTNRNMRIDLGLACHTDLSLLPVTGDQVGNANALNELQKSGSQLHGMWR